MEIILQKSCNTLIPADNDTAEYIAKLKTGQIVRGDFKKMHNYQFFKKLWALFEFAYDHWTPDDVYYKGELVGKSFNRFRKDLTILAGFYESTFDINGGVHLEAKSISFAKMEAEEFEELYSKIIDVILKKVLVNYSKEELDQVINNLMSFA